VGSKKPKIEVVQYYMSLWYGFATGPVDAIKAIFVDEKEIWSGEVTESAGIYVKKPDLFGGIKKEGGVEGLVTYLDGRPSQTIPEHLANKMNRTEATCPAHRGISSLFFTGYNGSAASTSYGGGVIGSIIGGSLNALFSGLNFSSAKGFYWRANQPNIPPISIKATRSPKVLNALYAMVGDDANPVHIIYEVLTNTDWGLGVSPLGINTPIFDAASQVVFNEEIGVSVLWVEQQTGEDFIASMLEYIEAVVFVNPRNGLIEIKLIRDDYEVDDLFEITPDNAKLSSFQRKLWAETINELTVTWTNPDSEEEESVTAQDLGNMAIQEIVTQTKSFKGVRNADLAMRLAQRDLRVASAPLMSCRATVNRSAWAVVPGDVVKVTWPEHGMTNVVMRVGEVDYGKSNDSAVKLSLTEDIFALDVGQYNTPPPTAWVPTDTVPAPMDYSQVTTLPYYLLVQSGEDISVLTDPDVVAAVFAADDSDDVSSYVIMSENADAGGTTVWEGAETKSPLSRSQLTTALTFSGTTSVAYISDPTYGYGVEEGYFAVLGYGDENQEYCLVTDIGSNNVTLKRGLLDTVPRAWPIGTPVWFLSPDSDVADTTIRIGDQPVTFKLLTMTSLGVLALDDAPELDGDLTRRPWLPTRPADCRVNGVASGTVEAIDALSLSLTWKNRNRLYEDSVVMDWTDPSVTPEDGQTTTITVIAEDNTILSTTDGLTGTSYALPIAAFAGRSRGWVKFTSKTSAGESMQGHSIYAIVGEGYGYGYGYNYG